LTRGSRIPGRRLFQFPRRTAAQVAADVEDELQFHLEMVARELTDDGWPPEAARAEALRRFGDLEGTRRICGDLDRSKEAQMKWIQALEALGQDLRFAGRQLWKNPGFTLVVVLTLALAVGASTAIFSVVHGILLRPLPYPEPERVISVHPLSAEGERSTWSIPNYVDWRKENRTTASSAIYEYGNLNLSRAGEPPERLIGMWSGADFFRVLGARPLAGRWFLPEEDQPGGARVAVISEKLWEQRFGRDPAAVGKPLLLNGETRTVIGVISRRDQYPDFVDAWLPLVLPEQESYEQRGLVYLNVLARLASGATLEGARAETRLIGERLAKQYPESNGTLVLGVMPLQQVMVGDVRTPLLMLLGAVLFVLLIACANVANLLLVRSSAREGEVAVRTALGAGRGRIVRQLLTESVVLALTGGAAGIVLAIWATKALVTLAPQGTPRLEEVGIDGTVLLFALGITVATGLLFGLAPAIQASRPNLAGTLKEGSRGSKGRASTRARNALVVAEIALAVVLLAVAGLLLQSFARLQSVDLGFQPEGVVKFHLAPAETRYPTEAELAAFVDRLIAEMEQLPGVTSAGATVWGMPLLSGENTLSISIPGRAPKPPGQEDELRTAFMTPGFFRTLGIPVLRGRDLTRQDRAGAPPVMLINQAAAERFFPGMDPVGQRIRIDGVVDTGTNGAEIVGVVRDFKQSTLEEQITPQMFLPHALRPMPNLAVVLRTEGSPEAVVAAARARLQRMDPDLPLYAVKGMEEIVAGSAAQPKFYMLLLGGFAVTALVLAAVGIYGVIAFAVRQRTQEIGIRMALGATREKVLRMVVRQGLTLAVVGALAGLAGALFASRGMQSLLYQVSATDPTVYTGVALLLVLVAGLASYLPARRAARTELLLALRGQV
jgi:putative ABC transport system permease protein